MDVQTWAKGLKQVGHYEGYVEDIDFNRHKHLAASPRSNHAIVSTVV